MFSEDLSEKDFKLGYHKQKEAPKLLGESFFSKEVPQN